MRSALSALLVAAFALPAWGQTRAPSNEAAAPAIPAASAFSASVTIDGGRIYVGRPGAMYMFPMPSGRQGGVHVYSRSGGEWSQTAAVSPDEIRSATAFGQGLDAAGDLMAVGAPSQGDGTVYVYRRSGADWALEATLGWSEADEGSRLGAAVATDGDRVVAGAPGANAGRGAVVVFARAGGEWAEEAVWSADGEAEKAGFGTSVALERDLAAAGAPGEMISRLPGVDPPALMPGAVHVYRIDDGGWALDQRLAPDGDGPAAMGWSLALSGGEIFAGAPLAGAGAVHRFAHGGEGADASWSLVQRLLLDDAPDAAGLGVSVAVSGDDVIAGAPLIGGGTGGGAAFRRQPSGDYEQVALFGPGGPLSYYGLAVAVGEEAAVVGAPGADYFEGAGFLFRRTASGWEPEGSIIDDDLGLEPLLGEERECEQGSVERFTCREVDMVSFLPVPSLGGDRRNMVNDLWGWTDPQTGREYAIVGRADGTAFVDLGDPAHPVLIGDLPLTEGATPSLWRDIKVHADHAFIVADNAGEHGMQIFDLTQLRGLSGPPRTFEATAHYDGIHSTHNIVMNEATGFAFAAGASGGGETCGGGLHMIDVRDPRSPAFAGCFADPTGVSDGYSHDAQCVSYDGPDERYAGREICFGSNASGLSIADVTDKDNPVSIAAATYPNAVYLHQGWITDDHRYFFMNDEIDELAGSVSHTRTLVWDISELDDPLLVREHFAETEATDHNLYILGDVMYQANYTSGLRILDISNPEEPRETGFFDTVPFGDDQPGAAGAFSVYPYFSSGLIIVSSIKEGLFVLRRSPPRVS